VVGEYKRDVKTHIMYINIRSLTPAKVTWIRALMEANDVMMLTETWGNKAEFAGKQIIERRRSSGRGGGAMIIIPEWWEVLEEGSLIEDGDDVWVRVKSARDKAIWMCSLYVQPSDTEKFRKSMKKLSDWVRIIHCKEKNPNILISGDLNKNLESILKESRRESDSLGFIQEYQLRIGEYGPVTLVRPGGGSRIDYILSSKNLIIEKEETIQNAASDHMLYRGEVSVGIGGGRNMLMIPNRHFGKTLMKEAFKKEQQGKNSVMKYYELLRKGMHRRVKPMRVIKSNDWRQQIQTLFTGSLGLQEIQKTLRQRWTTAWQEFEDKRFSGQQKQAFEQLRRMTKYDVFERRDGGIVRNIVSEEGKLISNGEEWQRMVGEYLQKLHEAPTQMTVQAGAQWGGLESLSNGETIALMEMMSCGKAVSFDLVGDDMFAVYRIGGRVTEDTLARAEALRHVWCPDFLNSRDLELALEARVIPLNKKFPKAPKVNEIRPIVVSSQLVKFMEMRFVGKLREWMKTGICKAQTGFVPEMGTEVNLWRILRRANAKKASKPLILFIDFSNAYNTVFHKRLFQELRQKQILDEAEIKFLEGLYTRTKLRLGKYAFTPQRGVMQGSVISPYLFNIYLDELFIKLIQEEGIDLEDLFGYADDIAILCDNEDQVRRVIQLILKWGEKNGLNINKKKCGILQVVASRNKVTVSDGEIQGIPVVRSYRYLGVHLDNKLNPIHHVKMMKQKISYLIYRLKWLPWKYTSVRLRHNLWTVFIKPLVDLGVMLGYDSCKTQKQKLLVWGRSTFKQLMGLGRGVSNRIVDKLMLTNMEEQVRQKVGRAERKWRIRVEDRERDEQDRIEPEDPRVPSGNLRWVPETMVKIINIVDKVMCKKCEGMRLTLNHMESQHGIRCQDLDIEKDLEGVLKIQAKSWRKINGAGKQLRDRIVRKYNSLYAIISRSECTRV